MKTIKKIEIEPIFCSFIPELLEENKLYISEEYNCAVHKCLCGCGNKTVTPLHDINGWKLIKSANGKVSLTPSISNYQLECKSHYIITNNVANFV